METEKIIGREKEQIILERFFNSTRPEFLAIYGRRRIGKTYLIRNFFRKKTCYFFNITGIHNASIERQIKEFTKEIGKTFYEGMQLKEKDNWFDTFEMITDTFKKIKPKNKKIVLFFDEFPWLATHRSKLLEALDYYWNHHWSRDTRIKLIICGSAASWIINQVVNNKGGLHNRLTKTIQLEPMNLLDTKEFLYSLGVKLNIKHITQIYMVTGGIPYYLSHVNPGLSAAKIIDELAFNRGSFLLKEFDNLFASLFEDPEVYVRLIREIARKRYGISQEELFKKVFGLSTGGSVIKKMRDLENAGFILGFRPYQHQKKGIYYKVIDEYTLFYFDWIEPIKNTLLIKSLPAGYWQRTQKTPAWYSWAGYAFEAICYKHLGQINDALALGPTAIPSAWRYSALKAPKENGAQIDLLFDRDDDALTICEIKYTDKPFIINKSYAAKLNEKIKVFKRVTRTKKQIFLAMISANGLKENQYSAELMDGGMVVLEDLFMK